MLMQKSFTETRPFFKKAETRRTEFCKLTLVHPHVSYQGLSMKPRAHHGFPLEQSGFPERGSHTIKRIERGRRGWGAQGTSQAVHGRIHSSILNGKEENHQSWSSSKHHPPNETAPQSGVHYQAGAAVANRKAGHCFNPQSFEATRHSPRILASWILNYIQ